MKGNHSGFVSSRLQVIYISVSNVDNERAFSAYGDILTPKRNRLTARNTEIYMCFCSNDEIDNDCGPVKSEGEMHDSADN